MSISFYSEGVSVNRKQTYVCIYVCMQSIRTLEKTEDTEDSDATELCTKQFTAQYILMYDTLISYETVKFSSF